jgi:hypothetical protein
VCLFPLCEWSATAAKEGGPPQAWPCAEAVRHRLWTPSQRNFTGYVLGIVCNAFVYQAARPVGGPFVDLQYLPLLFFTLALAPACACFCFVLFVGALGFAIEMSPQTKFYGSQVGSKVVIPHSYTNSPLGLLRQDVASAFSFWKFLPFIVLPYRPQGSGPLCELYPSASNLWSMFLHFILFIMQLPFILSVPFWIFFPVWSVLGAVIVFWLINQGICYLLNGSQMRYPSNPKFAKSKTEHEHEQWIFLNGVAVGCVPSLPTTRQTHSWMQETLASEQR